MKSKTEGKGKGRGTENRINKGKDNEKDNEKGDDDDHYVVSGVSYESSYSLYSFLYLMRELAGNPTAFLHPHMYAHPSHRHQHNHPHHSHRRSDGGTNTSTAVSGSFSSLSSSSSSTTLSSPPPSSLPFLLARDRSQSMQISAELLCGGYKFGSANITSSSSSSNNQDSNNQDRKDIYSKPSRGKAKGFRSFFDHCLALVRNDVEELTKEKRIDGDDGGGGDGGGDGDGDGDALSFFLHQGLDRVMWRLVQTWKSSSYSSSSYTADTRIGVLLLMNKHRSKHVQIEYVRLDDGDKYDIVFDPRQRQRSQPSGGGKFPSILPNSFALVVAVGCAPHVFKRGHLDCTVGTSAGLIRFADSHWKTTCSANSTNQTFSLGFLEKKINKQKYVKAVVAVR